MGKNKHMKELSSIMVALDSSSGSKFMLKAAAELANKAQAELRALYVEDIEWFEASKYNFTQQISSYTGSMIPFSEEHIVEQSRALDVALQKIFAKISNQMQLRYSYRSVRGVVRKELLEAASGVDLLIIGRVGRYKIVPKNIGSVTKYLAEQSTTPLLIWNNGSEWPQQIIGICSTPSQSLPTIRWTMMLGGILERSSRLFFSPGYNLDEELRNLEDLSIDVEKIRRISQILPDKTAESLNSYRKTLFIVQRSIPEYKFLELLEKVYNTILML